MRNFFKVSVLILVVLLCTGGVHAQKVFSCDYKSDAKVKVFVADYKSDADLVIYFADYKSDAGWKNSSKKHLLY